MTGVTLGQVVNGAITSSAHGSMLVKAAAETVCAAVSGSIFFNQYIDSSIRDYFGICGEGLWAERLVWKSLHGKSWLTGWLLCAGLLRNIFFEFFNMGKT